MTPSPPTSTMPAGRSHDHDPRPAAGQAGTPPDVRLLRGWGQDPGTCHDRHGRCKGICYGAVPALTLAVAMATLSRARVSSTLAKPWACLRRSALRLFQSGRHTGSAISAPSPASGDPIRPLRGAALEDEAAHRPRRVARLYVRSPPRMRGRLPHGIPRLPGAAKTRRAGHLITEKMLRPAG